MEKIDYLINELIKEDKRLIGTKIPEDMEEKKILFRALRNIREPKPISKEYLSIQDEFLKSEIENKGIINHEDIPFDKGIISIWKGDITTIKCDAIVNACNEYLLGCFIPNHNCIDNAIHSYAGIELREECNNIMKGSTLPNGEVVLTHGYNLPSKYVIETVGPKVNGYITEEDRNDLKNCYLNSLELSKKEGIKSITFPCISTGLYGFPKKEASIIAINIVKEYLEKNKNVFSHIIFNVFNNEDYNIYKNNIS
jgi:O-acetyl-ADP-ribose deacetylase (regulator of RNase III)